MRKELINELRRRELSNGTSLGRHDSMMDAAADELDRLQQENEQLRKLVRLAMRDLYNIAKCEGTCSSCLFRVEPQIKPKPCTDCYAPYPSFSKWQWRYADKLNELGVEV